MFALSKLHWIAIAVAIAVAVSGATAYHFAVVGGLKSQLDEKKAEVVRLTEENISLTGRNIALEAENGNFKVMVENQNSKIQDFKVTIDKNIQASSAALRKAQTEALVWKGKISTVLSSPPAVESNLCMSYENKLDTYLGLRWEQIVN